MSTPTTGPAPDAPEQSSFLRPNGQFRYWFVVIVNFLKASLPSGADRYDTLTVNNAFTAAPDWKITSQSARRWGRGAWFEIVLEYTGPVVSVAANGDIANQIFATTNGGWRPAISGIASSSGTGNMANGGVSSGGNAYISSVAPNTEFKSGYKVSMAGTFIVA